VDPRAGLDDVEKRRFLTVPGLELRPLGRPSRSRSLNRLRSAGSAKIGLVRPFIWVRMDSRKRWKVVTATAKFDTDCTHQIICFQQKVDACLLVLS
jgi:hypothetical protein